MIFYSCYCSPLTYLVIVESRHPTDLAAIPEGANVAGEVVSPFVDPFADLAAREIAHLPEVLQEPIPPVLS